MVFFDDVSQLTPPKEQVLDRTGFEDRIRVLKRFFVQYVPRIYPEVDRLLLGLLKATAVRVEPNQGFFHKLR